MARLITSLWALSCALSLPAAAQDTVTYPATVEFDVVFPGNKTYAPAPLFPVVFAVQNLAAAAPATPISIQWSIVRASDGERTVDITTLPNTTSSDPYYLNLWSTWLSKPESVGQYALEWGVNYNYCPAPDETDDLDSEGLGDWSIQNLFYFTIEPGAQQPDLGIDMDTCPVPIATLEITEDPSREPRSICAITTPDSEQPGPANPCAARLNKEAASSIAAELTASACSPSADTHRLSPALTVGCPPAPTQTTEESLGFRVTGWTGPGMLVGPLLAGFLLYAAW